MQEGRKINDSPDSVPLENVVVTERSAKDAAQLGYSKENGNDVIPSNKKTQPL